jgi:cell division topological specificity factor
MMEWVKRVFGAQNSSSTAKERLRLVLMTDHLALAPEIIENMKRDLVDVISRYVEVDREKVEVNFEREDRALAMLANIPIVSVNRPSPPPAPPTKPPEIKDEPPAVAKAAEAPPVRRRRRRKPPGATPVATPPKPAAANP